MKNKALWVELIAYVPWYDTDRIENETRNNSSVVAYVFVAAVSFTEPLPSNDKGIHIQTQTDGRDLLSTALRWAQVPWYTSTYRVS
jgi:hypothetical protein